MAEQAVSAVASAVIGGITDSALATVLRKVRSRSRPPAAHEKLQRLETHVLQLRSVIQVSERHAIESTWLLEWRDRLRDAAEEGGAVVLDFQRRAREEDGDAGATGASGQQQPAGGMAGALYFTRSALSGMAQRVRDVTRRLFSTDEDVQKLDGALEKMERLSRDMTRFLMALQLEVTPPAKRTRLSRTRASCVYGDSPKQHDVVLPKGGVPQEEHRSTEEVADEPAIVQLASVADAREDGEREARMLAMMLEAALQDTESKYIRATDGRDMGGLEWLAEWAGLLREAVERANAVLQTLRRPGSDVILIHEQPAGGSALEEDGELYSFLRAVQRLARDAPCFAGLVDLYALGNRNTISPPPFGFEGSVWFTPYVFYDFF